MRPCRGVARVIREVREIRLRVDSLLCAGQDERCSWSARGCSSAVERQLPKLNVAGSIPATRSSSALRQRPPRVDPEARWTP